MLVFSGIYRIWFYLFCSNMNFYSSITEFSATIEFPRRYDKLHPLRIELLEIENMIILDTLSEMTFYCSISFYFCMDIFQNAFTDWLPKQLLNSFIPLGLYFFWFCVEGGASSFENIPLVQNCWHYLTSGSMSRRTINLFKTMTGQEDWLFPLHWDCLFLSWETEPWHGSEEASNAQLLHPSGKWHLVPSCVSSVVALVYFLCSLLCLQEEQPSSSSAMEDSAFCWLCFQPREAGLLQTYQLCCCWRR